MKLDVKAMKWVREPKHYSVTSNKIEIITEPYTDCGSAHIIIFVMIMLRFCRFLPMRNFLFYHKNYV